MQLRRAHAQDIAVIMAIERTPGYDHHISRFERHEHDAHLASPDWRYWMADSAEAQGFVLASGHADPHGNVLFRRIAAAPAQRGLGSAMVGAALQETFALAQVHRVYLDVLRTNARARAVYTKLGFVEEGAFREAFQLPDGSRVDRVVMSILRRDFKPGAI